MEALHFSNVASRHFSSTTSPSSNYPKRATTAHAIISSSSTGSTHSLSFCSRNLFNREVWGMVNLQSVIPVRKEMGSSLIVRAEMFGQLTSGLESAWNKLKGEGQELHAYCWRCIQTCCN